MMRLPGPGDGTCDTCLVEDPCQRQLSQTDVKPVRDRPEAVDDLEVLLEDPWCIELVVIALHLVLAAAPVIFRELGLGRNGPRQQTVGHRAVADDARPVLL